MSTAVTKRADAAVSTIQPAVLQRIAKLAADAPRGDGDLGALLERIMDCETIDEAAHIWDGLDNTADVANVPLMIESFILRESRYNESENALPFYATVYGKNRLNNDEVVFNTGAATVLITLLTGFKRNWFPFTAHIELKDLANGYTAANLVFDA